MKKTASLFLTLCVFLSCIVPTAVFAEGASVVSEAPSAGSLIPPPDAEWFYSEVNGSNVVVSFEEDGSLIFSNDRKDLWPCVSIMYNTPVIADVETDFLLFDFDIANYSTDIRLIFETIDGAQVYYSVSNTALPDVEFDTGSGDMYPGTYKCVVPISELVCSSQNYLYPGGMAFPQEAIIDGQLRFVGVCVYAVGPSVLTVRDICILDSAEQVPDEPAKGENLALGKEYIISEQFRQGGADVNWGWDENAPVAYPDESFELTDGGIPMPLYSEAGWMGFNDRTPAQAARGYAYIQMDLEDVCYIDSITLTALKQLDVGITIPHWIEYWLSTDGENYVYARNLDLTESEKDAPDLSAVELACEIGRSARYVEIRVFSYEWAFLSELEIFAGEETVEPEKPDLPQIPDDQKTYENTLTFDEETGEGTVEVPYGYTWDVDYVDGVIRGEDVTIITNNESYNACNPNWAITVLLQKQADGTYVAIGDAIVCPGSAEGAGVDIGEREIALVVHSASSNPDWGYMNWLGKIVACSVKAGDVFVVDLNEMKVTSVRPQMAADTLYGDANGDGAVDGKDATHLLAYLANYDYQANISTVEVFDGADCNGDGEVNGKDATRLLIYLANYDPDTGSSSVELGK